MSVKSLRRTVFKLTQTVRSVNVIQIVLVTVVRVVLIQRGTVVRIASDDFFWYFIRWPDSRREFLDCVGDAFLSRRQTHYYYLLKMLSGNFSGLEIRYAIFGGFILVQGFS